MHGLEQRNNNDWQTEHALRNPSVDGNSAVRKLKVRSFEVRLCTMVIEHLLEQRDASPVQIFRKPVALIWMKKTCMDKDELVQS